MTATAALDAFIASHMAQSTAELARLCAQPSISATGEGMAACADLVAGLLAARGFDVELLPTSGYPVVVAEARGHSARTLLFYNHYDVQPPEPLELWDSPPFEPTVRAGALYARGAIDDKGNLLCRLAALDAVRALHGGAYPCNIKFVIEGEEETGSTGLEPFVAAHKQRLAADACIWEFGGVDHLGNPNLFLGLRGICYVGLSVRSLTQDVHSGLGGSIFPNAAWRLTWALNSLKDSMERILIPGFYDAVQAPSARDLELLAHIPDPAQSYREHYGVTEFLRGVTGGVALERQASFEPTCTICGLNSGYQGAGSKTVLPAEASAKVDFRLVPNQTPADILQKLRSHLDAQGFGDVLVEDLGSEPPARTDPDHPFVQMAADTARVVYGREPVLVPMSGGSGPNHAFIEHLKVPIVTCGAGYPGSQAHAPNEHVRLDMLQQGIRHSAHLLQRFADA